MKKFTKVILYFGLDRFFEKEDGLHTYNPTAEEVWGLEVFFVLKVPKCEIFDLFDFNDFYVIKVSIGRGL